MIKYFTDLLCSLPMIYIRDTSSPRILGKEWLIALFLIIIFGNLVPIKTKLSADNIQWMVQTWVQLSLRASVKTDYLSKKTAFSSRQLPFQKTPLCLSCLSSDPNTT